MESKRKKSLAVILSSEDELILLENFRYSKFNIKVFMMDDISTAKIDHTLPFDFLVFQAQRNMPGYMREIEDKLEAISAVVLFSDTTMVAFQAARFCEKLHKSLFVVFLKTELRRYENFKNLRVIRDLVQRVALRYITATPAFRSILLEEGLSPHKIKLASFEFKKHKFSVESARKKFRSYIGISQHEVVFACFSPLVRTTQLEVLIDAYSHFLGSLHENQHSNYRLVFVGSGDSASTLKTRCVDHALADRVAFIEQDIFRFSCDLLASVDVSIFPRDLNAEHNPAFCPNELAWTQVSLSGLTVLDQDNAFTSMIDPKVPKCVNWDEFSLLNLLLSCSDLVHQGLPNDIQKTQYAETSVLSSIEGNLAQNAAKDSGGSRSKVTDIEVEVPQRSQALGSLDAIIENPDSSSSDYLWACVTKAEKLRVKGDLDGASIALGMAIQEDSKDPKVFIELGKVSLEGEAFDEAIIFFKQAYNLDPNQAEALFGIGQSHLRVGLFVEALHWLEKAVVLSPTNRVYTGTLAHTCLFVADKRKAIDTLEKTIDSIGESSSLFLALGKLYLGSNQLEKGNYLIQKGLSAG